jgi:hypothetical protein
MKRSRKPQPPDRLEALARQAADYALHMMSTTGSVPPTVIADTEDGYVFCMPSDLADEAAKDRFAGIARHLAVAQDARALVMVVEAWAKFATPDGQLDMDTPPSQSPDRREVVVLMLEDRSRSAVSMIPIVRDESGSFARFGTPPPLDYNDVGGRFAKLMPRHRPSAREAAAARAELLAMGMNIVNRGPDPSMN